MNIIAFIIGVSLLGFGIYQEIRWRNRIANWHHTDGKIVEAVSNIKGDSPRIKFRYKGKSIKFVAAVNHGRPIPIGKTVKVLYDPKSGSSRLLNLQTRWTGTFLAFYLALGFICGSIFL